MTDPAPTFAIGGDLDVRRLGYGAMRLTGPGIWGPPADPENAKAVLRRVVDLGVNLIDTADAYGPEVADELIAEALSPYPAGLVIATKAGHTRTGPNRWVPVGRPEYLRQQAEMSLRRLRVDQIDLFQLHRIDPKVPAEEQFGLLKELRDEGKVRHVGLSEVGIDEIEKARAVVEIATVQNLYNLGDRHHEDVLRHCEHEGIGFIPWFPLGSGKLSTDDGALRSVAAGIGATPAQVAIAWLLHRSAVVLPIPGTASIAHLEENCAAATIKLEDQQMATLDAAYPAP
jgi:pyridoxine 4-dehydrogenase